MAGDWVRAFDILSDALILFFWPFSKSLATVCGENRCLTFSRCGIHSLVPRRELHAHSQRQIIQRHSTSTWTVGRLRRTNRAHGNVRQRLFTGRNPRCRLDQGAVLWWDEKGRSRRPQRRGLRSGHGCYESAGQNKERTVYIVVGAGDALKDWMEWRRAGALADNLERQSEEHAPPRTASPRSSAPSSKMAASSCAA